MCGYFDSPDIGETPRRQLLDGVVGHKILSRTGREPNGGRRQCVPRHNSRQRLTGQRKKPTLVRNLFEREAAGARPENADRDDYRKHSEGDKNKNS
jgi:hypothetical protein